MKLVEILTEEQIEFVRNLFPQYVDISVDSDEFEDFYEAVFDYYLDEGIDRNHRLTDLGAVAISILDFIEDEGYR